jgi:ABC-type antimicrobial peptide transport system permease subunit
MAGALRKQIEDANRSVKVTGMTLQSTQIDDTVISERLLAVLGGLFAAIALPLATVGLYGVIRYAAARRQKEVGIRIALGARRTAVLRLVWSDVAIPVVAGLLVGIAGGAAAARFLETVLYEVKPTDAASLVVPVLCIVVTCVVTALPPAMRAARTDPMTVLRHE